jgi:hypothetical protein
MDKSKTNHLPYLQWGVLNTPHCEYDDKHTKKMNLLYKGGKDIIKNVNMFVPQWNREPNQIYKDRCACATYENNFAHIINDYVSALYQKPLAILPAVDADDESTPGDVLEKLDQGLWLEFSAHANLKNQPLTQVLQEATIQAEVHQTGYIAIDFKKESQNPYISIIDPLSVLDYEQDEAGNFILIILKTEQRKRMNVGQKRNMVTTTFKVWTKEDVDNDEELYEGLDDKDRDNIRYDIYELVWDEQKPPSDTTLVPWVDGNYVDFKEIPIETIYFPDTIYTGGIIGQPCATLFQRYTSYLYYLTKAQNPILVYAQGEGSADDGDVTSAIDDIENRGSTTLNNQRIGSALTGPKDKVYWAEINGNSFKVMQEQLKQDKNEIYRLVSQLSSMIGTSDISLGNSRQSGLAKQMDNYNKEIVLQAKALIIKETAKNILKKISDALNKDYEWQTKGMDNYQVVDDDILLKKIQMLDTIRNSIPSKTSFKQCLTDMTYELHPYTNPGTLLVIGKEISDAVDAASDDVFAIKSEVKKAADMSQNTNDE